MSEPTFRTAEVSRISGATKRQIQNWDELGLVDPLTIKHVRTFPARRAFAVMLIAQLRAKGLPLQKIKKLPCISNIREVVADSRASFFITDGTEVFFAGSAFAAMETMCRATSPLIAIDLQKLRMRLGLNGVPS